MTETNFHIFPLPRSFLEVRKLAFSSTYHSKVRGMEKYFTGRKGNFKPLTSSLTRCVRRCSGYMVYNTLYDGMMMIGSGQLRRPAY